MLSTQGAESMKTMNQNIEMEVSMNQRANQKVTARSFPVLMVLMTVVILMMLSAFVARSAYADQVTLLPDGDVLPGSWTPSVGPLLSDDVNAGGGGAGDASYVTITGALDTFTVSMANNAAYSGATINAVRVYVRAAVFNGGAGGERITFGSTSPVVSTSGNNTLVDNTPTDAFFDLVGITNSGDVDALEISVNTTSLGAGEEARIYDVWVDVTYTPDAAANELNACDGCHTQPPVEGLSRNVTEGAVVGSHASHSAFACTQCHPNNAVLNHRGGLGANGTEGQIDMLPNISGGTYALGSAGFAQDNEDGTGLGICSNVSCHSGVDTPKWGDATGLDCAGCHGAPPTTNGDIHGTHYTAKGWGATDLSGTHCLECHPDNTTTHPLNGTVDVTLTPSGVSPAISCGSAPALGCHNGKATPNWDTTGITCQQCHSAGGADPADPNSGLHDETAVVSGLQHHPADPNFSACEDCHTATPSDNHWDGIFQNSAPIINFDIAATGFVDGTPPTCTSSCHNDSPTSGPWARKWHEDSDLDTGAQCAGCHGDWVSGWNSGVTHRSDSGAGSTRQTHSTGTDYECQDCHGLGAKSANTGYTFTSVTNDWGGTSKHGNSFITMNDNGTAWARSGGFSGCSPCHPAFDGTDGAAGQNSFTQTGWTPDFVTGEAVNAGCDTCHGGGGDYWPKGASYPDTAGEHQIHVTRLAAEIGFGLPGTDAQQKQMCDYCHDDPNGAGGGNHDDNGTPAAPSDVGGFNKIWDASADGTASYTAGNQTCANQCHNGKTTTATTFGWNDGFTAGSDGNCLACHTAGGGVANEIINPTTGLHDVTPSVSGVQHDQSLDASGCLVCHTSSPSSSHIDGVGQTSSPTITVAGSSGFSDGSPATCNASCHSDGANWARKWHENSTASDGNECAGCHGTFFTEFNNGVTVRHQTATSGDADGKIQSNHGTGASGKLCETCHAYDGADGLGHKWATHHMNDTIELSDNTTFSDDTATVSCGACHTTPYGTADGQFSFLDAGAVNGWGRAFVGGPAASCTGCHNAAGTGAAGVGPDSPHVITTRGGSFNACEDCHPGGSTGSQHSAAGVLSIGNASLPTGVSYTNGVNSYSGFNGIVLGGDAANAAPTANEATWCWGCHEAQTPDVSEWDGSSATYDLGKVTDNDLNWTTTSWESGQPTLFAYKTGQLASQPGSQTDASTHGVDGGSVGVDAVGNIGCTHCHDVHNTQGPDGAPYVRGTWQSNPYPEDGAPRNGASQTINSGSYGAVPRGNQNNNYGGYQIDQNNTGITVQNATAGAGLCELCHGNGDGTFTTGEVDGLDNDSSANTDWVAGSNSHARVVKGGSGSGAFNLYDEDVRLGQAFNSSANDGYLAGLPSMSYKQTTGGQDGYGFRGTDGRSFGYAPSMNNGSRPYGMNLYGWGATVNGTTVDPNYHQFSCSKCHNPHASRLPRLLITNCLDTKVNTWDNSFVLPASGSSDGGSIQAENQSVSVSNVTSAQNCHRLSDPAYPQANGGGWNNVSPW